MKNIGNSSPRLHRSSGWHLHPVIEGMRKSAEAISWEGRELLRSTGNDIRRKAQNDKMKAQGGRDMA